MNLGKSTVRSAAIMAGGGIFRQLMFFAATAMFAQKMNLDDFGVASIWYSLFLVMIGVADWGVRFSGWSAVAKMGVNDVQISEHLWLKALMSTIVFILFVFAILLVRPKSGSVHILGLAVFLLFINQLSIEWIFRGASDFLSVFVMNVISGLGMIFFAIISPPEAGPYAYLYAFLGSSTLAVFYGCVRLWLRGIRLLRVRPCQISDKVRGNLPLAIVSVLNRAYSNYPIIVVGAVGGGVLAAQFRPSHMLFMFVSTLSYYLVSALYSKFAAADVSRSELRNLAKRLLVLTALGFAICGLISHAFAESLILLFFGTEYLDAVSILEITFWLMPLGFLGMFVREFSPVLASQHELLIGGIVSIFVGMAVLSIVILFGGYSYLPVALGAAEVVSIVYGSFAVSKVFRAN